MTEETGDISTTFRSRKPSIDRKLNKIQTELQERSSFRKASVNQTLNFAVNLAWKYLEEYEKRKSEKESEIEKLETEKNQLDVNISEATEF